jgi:hypothetical protein
MEIQPIFTPELYMAMLAVYVAAVVVKSAILSIVRPRSIPNSHPRR